MDEINEERERLEREILILICEFERETGIAVRKVGLRRVVPEDGAALSIPDSVAIEVDDPDPVS